MDVQLKQVIQIEEELTQLLSLKQRDLFEKLKLEQSKMNSLSECKAFKTGVKFGVKLMTEVFTEKDKSEE